MISNKEKQLIESQVYRSYIKWRNGFVVKLAVFHFALVLIFDALAIYTPSVLTVAAWTGSAFTVGVIYAFGIVLSVIISTFYYSHRINRETFRLIESTGQFGGHRH